MRVTSTGASLRPKAFALLVAAATFGPALAAARAQNADEMRSLQTVDVAHLRTLLARIEAGEVFFIEGERRPYTMAELLARPDVDRMSESQLERWFEARVVAETNRIHALVRDRLEACEASDSIEACRIGPELELENGESRDRAP